MKKFRTVLLSITVVIALLISSTLTASAKANQAYSIGGEFPPVKTATPIMLRMFASVTFAVKAKQPMRIIQTAD